MEIYFKTSDHSSGVVMLCTIFGFSNRTEYLPVIEPKVSRQIVTVCDTSSFIIVDSWKRQSNIIPKNRISSAQSSPRHGIPDPDSAGCPAALYYGLGKNCFWPLFYSVSSAHLGTNSPVLYSRQVSPDYRCICRQHGILTGCGITYLVLRNRPSDTASSKKRNTLQKRIDLRFGRIRTGAILHPDAQIQQQPVVLHIFIYPSRKECGSDRSQTNIRNRYQEVFLSFLSDRSHSPASE